MISKRIDAIVKMVPEAGTVADIGCDHGKISCLLLCSGRAKRVICSDISAKSLDKARKLILSRGLAHDISLREGDGLEVLEEGEADIAVIAGMGGDLIAKILEKGAGKAPNMLVLSCNTAPEVLRKWLNDNGYRIENEDLVLENAHFYTVIVAKKGKQGKLSEMELELGPVLLKKRPETLKQLVKMRIEKKKVSRARIKASGSARTDEHLQRIDEKLKEYAEVMRCL